MGISWGYRQLYDLWLSSRMRNSPWIASTITKAHLSLVASSSHPNKKMLPERLPFCVSTGLSTWCHWPWKKMAILRFFVNWSCWSCWSAQKFHGRSLGYKESSPPLPSTIRNLGGFMAAFPTFGPGIASLSKGGTEKSEKHWNVEAVRRSPNFFQCLDMAKCCKSATLVVNVQPRLGKIY